MKYYCILSYNVYTTIRNHSLKIIFSLTIQQRRIIYYDELPCITVDICCKVVIEIIARMLGNIFYNNNYNGWEIERLRDVTIEFKWNSVVRETFLTLNKSTIIN